MRQQRRPSARVNGWHKSVLLGPDDECVCRHTVQSLRQPSVWDRKQHLPGSAQAACSGDEKLTQAVRVRLIGRADKQVRRALLVVKQKLSELVWQKREEI